MLIHADITAQAPVTNWPLRILLVALVVAVVVLVILAMRRGWNGRAERQSDIPAPPAAPAALDPCLLGPVQGLYVASTTAGDWLDRIVVHDLGVVSRAEIEVGPQGVLVRREGARQLFIPREALLEARPERGIAGKVYERGGVLILTWRLGGRLVDTGLRADTADEQAAIISAVRDLVAETPVAETLPTDERTS